MNFNCNYCQKDFPSKASLWEHNRSCRCSTDYKKYFNLYEKAYSNNETNLKNNIEV